MELDLQLETDVFVHYPGLGNLQTNSNGWEDLCLHTPNSTATAELLEESKEVIPEYNNSTNLQWWQMLDNLIHSVAWTVLVVLAYILILMVGLVGNSLVVFTYILRPKMRSVTNLFITNLAVADLFAVLFCFAGNLLVNTIEPWILGSIMCKAVAIIQGTSVCASAYFLAAISVDRCKAICQPFSRTSGLQRRHATYTAILIWVFALCLSMPWATTLTIVHDDGLPYCVELWDKKIYGKIYFLLVNFFIYYMVPLAIIVVANTIIWYHIQRREIPHAIASALSVKHMHRRTRSGVRKMLGIVTVVFLLSWLPLHILLIPYRCFQLSESERNVIHFMLPFAQYIGSCNSSINPLLYAYFNRKFREAFQSLLPCWQYFQRIKRADNDGPVEV